MGADKIVVFVLAFLFFGGIALLVWHSRKQGKASLTENIPAQEESNNSPKPAPKSQRK
jgi:hypothetical protein